MSAEIPNPQGDAVVRAEANMWVYRYGEISHTVAASDWNRSCHTIIKRRLERACKTHISQYSVWAIMYKWYAKATRKGARQMSYRQSDGRIVPMKARSPKGISAGGKSRKGNIPHSPAMRNKLKRETLATHRR